MKIKYYKVTEYAAFCDTCDQFALIKTNEEDWLRYDTPSGYFKRQGWICLDGVNMCPSCAQRCRQNIR